MRKNWSKPKLTIDVANELRERYIEGDSINSLSKRYSLSRGSIKGILKGETYNKYGDHGNLMEKEHAALF
jgi:Mor family transcriptional regulator